MAIEALTVAPCVINSHEEGTKLSFSIEIISNVTTSYTLSEESDETVQRCRPSALKLSPVISEA